MDRFVHQQQKTGETGGQAQDLESTIFLRLSAFRVVTHLLALPTAPWQSTMPALLFSNICFPLFKGCSLFLCSIPLLKHTQKVVGAADEKAWGAQGGSSEHRNTKPSSTTLEMSDFALEHYCGRESSFSGCSCGSMFRSRCVWFYFILFMLCWKNKTNYISFMLKP